MGFRSEEEALRRKTEALAADLEEARRTIDEARPRLERVEALERQLRAAQDELARHRAKKKRPNRRPALIALVTLIVFAVGGAAFVLFVTASQRQEVAQRVAVAQAREHQHREARAQAEAERSRAEAEARAAAEAARRAAEARPPWAERTGRVTRVEGAAAPVDRRASCDVTLERTTQPGFDARLVVRCDERVIYGRPGFGFLGGCRRDADGAPERCEDRTGSRDEGDPMVVIDRGTGRVVVSDGPELPWTVEIALDGG
ncbi:MAG TPA: hypothetical protein RMH99_30060 [Sandaracinaceae bacterium LLY-WYZ-13_1]|nr:hypothetical protein [Sandaracinaceae bacterium LLY-WYZ-13_1]